MTIGRPRLVPLREVWKNEETDFTPWLAKNIDILGETIGVDVSVVEREKDVGPFSADLTAESPDGKIVIENQFGKSDHDHLGKLITYLTNLDQDMAIWICEDPQPEHKEAIDWLNKYAKKGRFYLIKLEVFQKEGDPESDYLPHFSKVSEPSETIRGAGVVTEELAETEVKRLEFWKQLLEKTTNKLDLFSNISQGRFHWISAGAGKAGLAYSFVILKDLARIEFLINSGDFEKNKKIFDELVTLKDQIEKDFGEPLEWQRLDDRVLSRIAKTVEDRGLNDEGDWSSIQDKMIEAMVRLEKAIGKHVKKL